MNGLLNDHGQGAHGQIYIPEISVYMARQSVVAAGKVGVVAGSCPYSRCLFGRHKCKQTASAPKQATGTRNCLPNSDPGSLKHRRSLSSAVQQPNWSLAAANIDAIQMLWTRLSNDPKSMTSRLGSALDRLWQFTATPSLRVYVVARSAACTEGSVTGKLQIESRSPSLCCLPDCPIACARYAAGIAARAAQAHVHP